VHVDVHSVWVAHRGLLYRLLTEALWYWLHVDVHAAWVAHRGTLVVVACGCALCIGCPQRPSVIGCMWMCTLYWLPTEAFCMGCPQSHFGIGCMWMCTLYWLPTEAFRMGCPQRASVLVACGCALCMGLPTEALCNWLHVDVHSVWVAHRGPL